MLIWLFFHKILDYLSVKIKRSFTIVGEMAGYKKFNSSQEASIWGASNYSDAEICQLNVRKNIAFSLGDYKGNAYRKINYIIQHG